MLATWKQRHPETNKRETRWWMTDSSRQWGTFHQYEYFCATVTPWGQHSVWVVATVTSQQEGSWSEPFCVELACSPCAYPGTRVSSGFSSFLPQSKDMHVWLVGGSKLPVGVIVSVHGCSSMCGPVMDWRPVQVNPCLSPEENWAGSSRPLWPWIGLSGCRWWMDRCCITARRFSVQIPTGIFLTVTMHVR